MKATIEFNLPEENIEFEIYSDAMNMHGALFQITANLRKQMEWLMEGDEECSKNGYALLDKVMDFITEETKDVKSLEL